MHFCSLLFVFPFSLRFCSLKPTPSLLINIGKKNYTRSQRLWRLFFDTSPTPSDKDQRHDVGSRCINTDGGSGWQQAAAGEAILLLQDCGVATFCPESLPNHIFASSHFHIFTSSHLLESFYATHSHLTSVIGTIVYVYIYYSCSKIFILRPLTPLRSPAIRHLAFVTAAVEFQCADMMRVSAAASIYKTR